MSSVFKKTFGGLSKDYLFRQYFFGLVIFGLFAFMTLNGKANDQYATIKLVFAGFCLIFYPYAHFVYDSIVGFIMGNNVFFVNGNFMILWKFLRMIFIFGFSLFIAPLGLTYLYFHHSRNSV